MKTCIFDQCTNKHDSHGFCANHARQYRKYGHPLSKDEVHERISKARTAMLLKYYAENPDRPKRLVSPEKRVALKGKRMNTGRTHFKKGYAPWNRGSTKYSDLEKLSARQQRLAFRKVRNLVIARDNSTCQFCDSSTEYPQVDHIKKWIDYPELRFELDNLRTLCMPCHYFVTYKRKLPQGTFWGHRSTTI